MKKLLLLGLFLMTTAFGFSQSKLKYGLGYYGETIFHPGLIVQAELDKPLNEKFSVPIRSGVGYYFHRNNHQAVFANLVAGLRWHAGMRYFIGLSGGVGAMASWHHSDFGVFQVDENGNVTETSNFAGIDFMPSVNLEFGYKLDKEGNSKFIWLRPKVFFQHKVNDKTLLHFSTAIGFTF